MFTSTVTTDTPFKILATYKHSVVQISHFPMLKFETVTDCCIVLETGHGCVCVSVCFCVCLRHLQGLLASTTGSGVAVAKCQLGHVQRDLSSHNHWDFCLCWTHECTFLSQQGSQCFNIYKFQLCLFMCSTSAVFSYQSQAPNLHFFNFTCLYSLNRFYMWCFILFFSCLLCLFSIVTFLGV